jgi:acetyltransferase-like isoleucine patch superfamily enzyme
VEGVIEIEIGDDVRILDKSTIAGLTVGEKPSVTIGSGTDISQPISILVGREVSIGSQCIISSSLITDNPGHNVDYGQRNQKLNPAKIGRIRIEDQVWTGTGSMIIGDVIIGTGSVIGAGAVVTKSVPAFCVVAGNPARIVKKLEVPKEMTSKLASSSQEDRKIEEEQVIAVGSSERRLGADDRGPQ